MVKDIKNIQWFHRSSKITFLKQSQEFQSKVLDSFNHILWLYNNNKLNRSELISEMNCLEYQFLEQTEVK